MLAALLTNQPYNLPSGGNYDHYKRRPNEKVKWCDEDLICQEELTKFKAKDEDEQAVEVKKAISVLKEAPTLAQDVQPYIMGPEALERILSDLDALEMVLNCYFILILRRNRENEDIAAMLALGIL